MARESWEPGLARLFGELTLDSSTLDVSLLSDGGRFGLAGTVNDTRVLT
jgi:hypothetical protein